MEIDEKQIEYVRPGSTVYLKSYADTKTTLTSEIVSIESRSDDDVQTAENRLPQDPLSRQNANNDPISANYLASAPITVVQADSLPGLRGQARIHVGQRTIGSRISRWLADTFRFRM